MTMRVRFLRGLRVGQVVAMGRAVAIAAVAPAAAPVAAVEATAPQPKTRKAK